MDLSAGHFEVANLNCRVSSTRRRLPGTSDCWKRVVSAVIGLGPLLVPTTSSAASCPYCYSQATSSSTTLLQAFRSGIVILMIPPFALSIALAIVAYRRRNHFQE